MEFPLIFQARSTNATPTTSFASRVVVGLPARFNNGRYVAGKRVVGVRASLDRSGDDGGERNSGGYRSSAMEMITFNNESFSDADFPDWDNIGAAVRLAYGIEVTADREKSPLIGKHGMFPSKRLELTGKQLQPFDRGRR
ncbi:hypothetical protein L1887_40411 [Cichorium endivia]|nr:hypothetical protein L1887_40411 [Cichorium endivia]